MNRRRDHIFTSSNSLVSIIIPVFNGSNYVEEAIKSALGQDYPNIEVIIVNDGSNDEGKTREKVLKFHDRVNYYEKDNGGVASALNEGIKQSTGEYISWLSHDDIYYLKKISNQMQHLAAADDNTISFTGYDLMASDRNIIQRYLFPPIVEKNIIKNTFTGHVFQNIFFSFDFSIHGCSLLIPKKAFRECGMFDESLLTTQDYDLWFKMMQKYEFKHLPESHLGSRIHPEQASRKMEHLHTKEKDELYSRAFHELFHEVTDEELINLAILAKMGGRSDKVIRLILYGLREESIKASIIKGCPSKIPRTIAIGRTKLYHRLTNPTPKVT